MVRESCPELESGVLIATGPADDVPLPDFLTFSLIIYLVRKSKAAGLTINILKTIAEDATWYFLVIFTSHLVLAITLIFGRVSVTAPPPSELQPMTSNDCL